MRNVYNDEGLGIREKLGRDRQEVTNRLTKKETTETTEASLVR